MRSAFWSDSLPLKPNWGKPWHRKKAAGSLSCQTDGQTSSWPHTTKACDMMGLEEQPLSGMDPIKGTALWNKGEISLSPHSFSVSQCERHREVKQLRGCRDGMMEMKSTWQEVRSVSLLHLSCLWRMLRPPIYLGTGITSTWLPLWLTHTLLPVVCT